MGKGRPGRPLSCIRMQKRPFGQRIYIGHCRWCFEYRQGANSCNNIPRSGRRSVLSKTQKRIGRSKLKGSDKIVIKEKLSNPDDVTTSKPRFASKCGMEKGLGLKASMRACSTQRDCEFDFQEKLCKPDDVTTSTPL